MALTGSPRRDQRRRMVVSWKRAGEAAADAPLPEMRPTAAYGAEAEPENQKGLATLLPTGSGGFTLAALVILLPMAATWLVALAEPLFGWTPFAARGRFTRTLAVAAVCLDPRGSPSLADWLAQLSLGLATIVALIVRFMRRHRRDDYNGRYRAWGWLAALFTMTACAGVVPLGRLVGAAIADATGVTLGPGGIGWWTALATIAFGMVSLWAVLPLHERGATAFWLTLTLVAWGIAAGGPWLDGSDRVAVAGHAAWTFGASLAAVAMLAAARSVIREVRGQSQPVRAAANRIPEEFRGRERATESADEEQPEFLPATDEPTHAEDDSGATASPEAQQRHLSKAERKRLKKLARMNRAAA